jgi:hypothetical protein
MNYWIKGNVTIPPKPRTIGGLISWGRAVNRALTELRDRKVVGVVAKHHSRSIKPPLFITLITNPTDPVEYEVYAQYGHVVPRHNAGGQTGEPIEIDDLPTQDVPLVITTNKKLWVELSIDEYGVCTAATFDSGTTWPEDNPPQLLGGDDPYGTIGERYIRIAEIINDPNSVSETPPLISDQLHTGHIDYAQPTLIENCGAPLDASEAGTLKAWSDTYGRWELRSIVVEGSLGMTVSGCNIIITDCS